MKLQICSYERNICNYDKKPVCTITGGLKTRSLPAMSCMFLYMCRQFSQLFVDQCKMFGHKEYLYYLMFTR